MDLVPLLDVLMFVAVVACLMSGFPVAFTLAGVALVFALLGHLAGASLSLGAIPLRIFGIMTNETLLAVPLFVFMGVMLERSRVAEDLLETMARMFGKMPGGLGLSVFLVGGLLAASTGIVGATVVTMGLLSLPTMLRNGYNPRLATGAIAASGTLGQIIPPSIVLVFLADQLSNAYQTAQRELGNWSPDPFSVGDLFAAALIPGLCLVGLYILYQLVIAVVRPQDAPPMQMASGERVSLSALVRVLIPPLALIVAVLGSILAGVATPTEAAAVGAVGAALLAAQRAEGARPWVVPGAALSLLGALALSRLFDLRVARLEIPLSDWIAIGAAAVLTLVGSDCLVLALRSVARGGVLRTVLRSSTQITAMVFTIMIGATFFSLVFRDLGGDELVHALLKDLPGGAVGAMLVVMAVMFLMGFFLDFLEIVFIVVPLVAPVLLQLPMPDGSAMHPAWLGVMMAVNLQTSFLTPPFGFALFYLRGVAPPEVKSSDIYRGIIPFVILQLLMLVILWYVPALATWLPRAIYG
ncbi:TRAP transporter large permease [Pannonibacter tanglangensis]|uniref:TRAP transporter large permease subunit n=1 Tax=Pannonibacter tanglangensis TaxID=2750084 RepID=A0ABW9ZN40_9HYPH|nr:TRAP transporter large permease subunit [Pannonibacter sp. XCT-34]NBN65332.1 TRAP transporter large permease subunit [Pannonibacter sp. XCT-34]